MDDQKTPINQMNPEKEEQSERYYTYDFNL